LPVIFLTRLQKKITGSAHSHAASARGCDVEDSEKRVLACFFYSAESLKKEVKTPSSLLDRLDDRAVNGRGYVRFAADVSNI
jgi:hypothetical protein